MGRRVIDVSVAVLAGAILIPVMAAVAVLVRVTMGRPVLFRQARSGWRGREFVILKFRTMRPPRDADEAHTDLDGGRLTPLGRWLRATSLDELPQLWNVVRGDMSIVGPRPTLPEQVAQYSPRQRGRLAVRPGLTGWAQVHGRNALPWPERIELDLWYIEHRRLAVDLRIVALTVARLLFPSGVVGEGGVNPGFPAVSGAPTVPDQRPSPAEKLTR